MAFIFFFKKTRNKKWDLVGILFSPAGVSFHGGESLSGFFFSGCVLVISSRLFSFGFFSLSVPLLCIFLSLFSLPPLPTPPCLSSSLDEQLTLNQEDQVGLAQTKT